MEPIIEYSKTSFGMEGWVDTKRFGAIEFLAQEEASLEYVSICANYLDALPRSLVDELFKATLRMYHDHQRRFGVQVKQDESPYEVSLLYSPILNVPEPRFGDKPALHLSFGCAWDEEHPIEWFVRDGEVQCVCMGPCAGAWEDFPKTASWNFASIT